MNDVIHWLNDNSSAVQAVSTVVLVLLTGWYAWLTHRSLSESNRPFVYLELVPQDPGSAILHVGNAGTSAAERVHFTVKTDVVTRRGESWGKEPPFVDGLDYIAPGGRLTYLVFLPQTSEGKTGEHVLDVEFKYHGAGRAFKSRVRFDVAQFNGTRYERPPSSAVTRALETIARRMPSESSTMILHLTQASCPTCRESVKVGATKCRYCQSAIPVVASQEPTGEQPDAVEAPYLGDLDADGGVSDAGE